MPRETPETSSMGGSGLAISRINVAGISSALLLVCLPSMSLLTTASTKSAEGAKSGVDNTGGGFVVPS